jgi:hypothetical protein
MKVIIKGIEIQIDDDEIWRLEKYSYHLSKHRNKYYLMRSKRENKKQVSYYLHREIMNCPKVMQIDHINRNTLDNRKCNLRICTCSENAHNSTKKRTNKSGFKGVYFDNTRKLWASQITLNRKCYPLGRYKTIKEARNAYKKGALKYHGIYANWK